MIHVSKCYQNDIAKQESSLHNKMLLRRAHLHPRCAALSESAQKLRFHYEDVHCVEFNEGTKRRLSDTEIDIDSEADMEVDGPEGLQSMTANKAEMKGTARQRAQYTFVHQTRKKAKATKASAATFKKMTSRRAKSRSIDVEDVVVLGGHLATANAPVSISQDSTASEHGISSPASDGSSPIASWAIGDDAIICAYTR